MRSKGTANGLIIENYYETDNPKRLSHSKLTRQKECFTYPFGNQHTVNIGKG